MSSIGPVFGIDCDGTLGDWHTHFWRYAQDYVGRELPRPYESSIDGPGYDGSEPLYKFLGLSKDKYREVKLAFRRGSIKRWMPAHNGASYLTRRLRKAGALVVICTTRPFNQVDTMEPDTVHWLRRERCQWDDLLLGEHKYRKLRRKYGAKNIVAVLDDLPEMLQQASELGILPVVYDQPWNRSYNDAPRVESMEAAGDVLLQALQDWKDNAPQD